MLDDLDRIEWGALGHAYGTAEDVPEALRALASADADARAWAQGYLDAAILHQGTIYSATPRVIPFLVRLVAEPTIQERHEILDFLAAVAESAGYEDDEDWGEDDEAAMQCAVELGRGSSLFVELLQDPEPEVRAAAGRLAALLVPLLRIYPEDTRALIDREAVLGGLRERIRSEESRPVRAALLRALGKADPDAPELWEELYANLAPERDPLARMTSALTLLQKRAPATDAVLRALTDAAVRWEEVVSAARESEEEAARLYPDELMHRLDELARQSPEAVYAPLLEALKQGETPERRQAARTLGTLLSPGIPSPEGRAPDPPEDTEPHAAAVVRALRAATREADPSVRASAAAALLSRYYGGAGEVAVLVEAVEGEDPNAASIATGALARVGPAGAAAVPALMRRLEALEAPARQARRPTRNLKQGIRRMQRSARSERLALAAALASMGPAAAPAAPLLVRLLDDPESWVASEAMTALERIGPAAPEVLPALLRVVRSRSEKSNLGGAIKALARFGPEAEGVVEALSEVVAEEPGWRSSAAKLLGEMGPGAGAAAPALRAAFEEEDHWDRGDIGRALAGVLPREEALEFLVRMLGIDYQTICCALWELQEWGEEATPAVPAILQVLDGTDQMPRRVAIITLAKIGRAIGPEAIRRVTQAMEDRDPEVAVDAARALRDLGEPRERWVPALIRLLAPGETRGEADWGAAKARTEAAAALWEAGEYPPEALEAMLRELQNPGNQYVRAQAARALTRLGNGGRVAAPELRRMLTAMGDDPSQGEIRISAAGALWAMGERTPEILEILTSALRNTNTEAAASEILGQLGSAAAPAIPALEAASQSRGSLFPDAHQEERARKALEKIRENIARAEEPPE
jgi:HEAT repeat protein